MALLVHFAYIYCTVQPRWSGLWPGQLSENVFKIRNYRILLCARTQHLPSVIIFLLGRVCLCLAIFGTKRKLSQGAERIGRYSSICVRTLLLQQLEYVNQPKTNISWIILGFFCLIQTFTYPDRLRSPIKSGLTRLYCIVHWEFQHSLAGTLILVLVFLVLVMLLIVLVYSSSLSLQLCCLFL